MHKHQTQNVQRNTPFVIAVKKHTKLGHAIIDPSGHATIDPFELTNNVITIKSQS